MAIQLDLTKSAQKFRLDLTKQGVGADLTAELCFDLDVPGSYTQFHLNGTTNLLVARLTPWGMALDPDRKLDVFAFSNDDKVTHVGFVNADNYANFVQRRVINKLPGWRGGTDYAPVLVRNLQTFGWIPEEETAPAGGGLIGRLFGHQSVVKPQPIVSAPQRKSLVLFNTDGENSDRVNTNALFARMQAERMGVYVMFIAVKQSKDDDFSFIQRMADKYDNCGLVIIENPTQWVQLSDDAINAQLLTPELVGWLKS